MPLLPPSQDTPVDVNNDPRLDAAAERPELSFDDGELAPCCASPYPDADLSDEEEKALKFIVDTIGNIDVAARRWEVEQAWMARLFGRGYQYLWPRRGGGWIYIPFATDYQHGRAGYALYGNETNIYTTYGEIITAALTRDIPAVRFEPECPSSDADITAAAAATKYARLFGRNNDLLDLQQQMVYYLCNDGRALIVTDHVIDAQRFGRLPSEPSEPLVPETEQRAETPPVLYVIRHGETDRNAQGIERGRSEIEINDRGERESERAAGFLKDKGITRIVSSPVERALSSAKVIAGVLNLPLEVDDRLASLDLGTLAGEPSASAKDEINDAFEETPEEPVGGDGEAPEEFEQRVSDALSEYLASPETVGLVVHDSVISQIFQELQGEDVPAGSNTKPGWVVGIAPEPDGTFAPRVIYPVDQPEIASAQTRGKPRGQEISTVYGVLEHKVPFASGVNATLADCLWVQVAGEVDVALAKAMFPRKADKIQPGGSAAGENELDRIARINATLALEASYVTGDSMVRDCTIQRTWIRPAKLMDVENPDTRRSLMNKFPDGALVTQAGDLFISARNECMDDHLTLVHAYPGSGQNRIALCSKLISIQKRLNNWMDLLDRYFVTCVPQRYIDQKLFDAAAIREQGGSPGGYIPFILDNVPPNRTLNDAIWMEPFPTAQPMMGEFIKWFTLEMPQMLSHALPTLFGAASNQDTATGILVQRDQALGSLGSPWHSIQVATASYFKQAVRLAAMFPEGPIEGVDAARKVLRIERGSLKGNILCYPESDANFPESWTQRQSRWQQLMQDAANPFVQKLLSSLPNRMKAVQAIGLEGVKDPDQDAWEKQQGEFEVLLKSGPSPNPEFAQAQTAIAESQRDIETRQAMGVAASSTEIQSIAQMEQALQAIPPNISTVPVRDTDNHQVEADCCLVLINSAEGRRLADGSAEDRAAFENLTLHYQEHSAKIKPPLGLHDLPKGISANLKDMPPDAAATALTAAGLETQGPDVVQNREFTTELARSKKIGGPPVPGTLAAQGAQQ